MRVGVGLGICPTAAAVAAVALVCLVGHKFDLHGPRLGLGTFRFLLLGNQIPIGMASNSFRAETEAMRTATAGAVPSRLDLVVAPLRGLLQRQHVLLALEFHGQLEVGGHNVLRGGWRFRNVGIGTVILFVEEADGPGAS